MSENNVGLFGFLPKQNEPSDAAMRAARALKHDTFNLMNYEQVATIIDRETGVKELVEALFAIRTMAVKTAGKKNTPSLIISCLASIETLADQALRNVERM